MAKFEFNIQLDGLSEALSFFDNTGRALPEAMTLGIKRVGLLFRDNMVAFAQAGHPSHPNVVSGRLSGSMRVDTIQEGHNPIVEVGSDAEYAPYVEFGHMSRSWGSDVWHWVPAYPWFMPAVTQTFDSGDANTLFQETVKDELL